MGDIGYIYGYLLFFVFLVGALVGSFISNYISYDEYKKKYKKYKVKVDQDTGMFTEEEFDRLEELSSKLLTMKSILGLCRTEKETLEEAAYFIISVAESTGYPVIDDDDEE